MLPVGERTSTTLSGNKPCFSCRSNRLLSPSMPFFVSVSIPASPLRPHGRQTMIVHGTETSPFLLQGSACFHPLGSRQRLNCRVSCSTSAVDPLGSVFHAVAGRISFLPLLGSIHARARKTLMPPFANFDALKNA